MCSIFSLIWSWKIIMHCFVACPLPSPIFIFIFIYITKINIELWHNPAQAGKSRNTYTYLITIRIIQSFHFSVFGCLARYLAQMILSIMGGGCIFDRLNTLSLALVIWATTCSFLRLMGTTIITLLLNNVWSKLGDSHLLSSVGCKKISWSENRSITLQKILTIDCWDDFDNTCKKSFSYLKERSQK